MLSSATLLKKRKLKRLKPHKYVIIFIDNIYRSWYIKAMIKTSKTLDKKLPVYISGPITSLVKLGEDWRLPFHEAEGALRRLGFREIHNPVDIAVGVDAVCEALGRKATYADYMKADLEMLLKCKTILLLKGWEGSRGAQLEYQVASALNLEIIYER